MTDDEYQGVYGDVVTEDIYRLRELTFIPDVVFDIGANVGCFARFARELWPAAMLVCVEPNPDNFRLLTQKPLGGDYTTLIAAIGSGKVWRAVGATNGAKEVYLSAGLGYDVEALDDAHYEAVDVRTVQIDNLFATYWRPGMKTVVKLDCEGGENAIIRHGPSIAALQNADYIAAELHFFASDGGTLPGVRRATFSWMADLMATHRIEYIHPMLYATRRQDGD